MSFSKFYNQSLNILALIALLVSLPVGASYAKAGCCSHHGGVAGCDNATGHQQCKDGTDSPSCPCNGTTMMKSKPEPKSTPAMKSKSTSNKSMSSPKTTPAPAKASSNRGCCSGHGGVAKCNKSTGFKMCKDGTQSTNCGC